MFRLIEHFFTIGTFISFFIFIYVIFLRILKKRVNPKLWRILCLVPLIISTIHFIIYFVPNNFIINRFIFMYFYSIIIALWQFLYKREKIFKISAILVIFLGFISFTFTFYGTIMDENIHNLNYHSYTKSFEKTISILKEEYVLNNHKKIDYDYLYHKYYPLIEQAESNNDEQLYFKTMFEFSKNFKDGHFQFSIYYTTLEETITKYNFMNDYSNKNYGFGTILLSDGTVAAILVDEDSEAYKQGIRDGMIITKKDGQNINEILNEIVTPIAAYPVLEDERLINSFYLFATGNEEIEVTFLNEENQEITIRVHSIDTLNTKPDELYNKILYYDSDLENLDTKMLDENTGYMYISHEMYSPFKGAIGYLIDDSSYLTKVVDQKIDYLIKQGMENLIIDLRANSGGYLTESTAIASLFTDDKYLVAKDAKYNSNLYDEFYLKGNGKYSDMEIIVLVNSDTASAGDILAYLFSQNPKAQLVGFTNSNNSAQSVGGIIFLSGGTSYITYPIYKSYDKNNQVFIDTNSSGVANVKLDYRISLTKENISEIIFTEDDYLLEYAIEMMK